MKALASGTAQITTPAPGAPSVSRYRRAFMITKEFVPISGTRSFAIMRTPVAMPVSAHIYLSGVTAFTMALTADRNPREMRGGCPRQCGHELEMAKRKG